LTTLDTADIASLASGKAGQDLLNRVGKDIKARTLGMLDDTMGATGALTTLGLVGGKKGDVSTYAPLAAGAIIIQQRTALEGSRKAIKADLEGYRSWKQQDGNDSLNSTYFGGATGKLGDVGNKLDELMGLVEGQADTGLTKESQTGVQDKTEEMMADFHKLSDEEKWEAVEAMDAAYAQTGSITIGQRALAARGAAAFSKYRGKDIKKVKDATETQGYDARLRMMHSALGGGRALRDVMGLGGKKDRNKMYKQYFQETGKMHPAQRAAIQRKSTSLLSGAGVSGAPTLAATAVSTISEKIFTQDREIQEGEFQDKEFAEVLAVGEKLKVADGVSRGNPQEKAYGKALGGLTDQLGLAAAAVEGFKKTLPQPEQ
jgi:hypothetical protein